MRFLRVTMENGEVWDIDLTTIAIDRARYYAELDNPDDTVENHSTNWHKTYNEEHKLTMTDESIATDWASGNMNWDEVEPYARKITTESKGFDYQDGWINGDMEIIKKDTDNEHLTHREILS